MPSVIPSVSDLVLDAWLALRWFLELRGNRDVVSPSHLHRQVIALIRSIVGRVMPEATQKAGLLTIR